ncbi:TraI domain-containing protein [Undibacterium sp. Jales W-56]|uniref:MobH family relaxase n=1 Tax=Undibacterium sp. Jales W-56 TaxID=2897325 RepID=UPI0021D0C179|nr:MobH family relaxase [Undibacterium sp. Jales W-56]MCU6435327.1 TraI domain-containing protein [Undibacterium sp. Jales W-56]
MRTVDRLLGSFGLRRANISAPENIAPPASATSGAQAAPYPPVDPGIPALSIDEILAPHSDLIERIKVCYGMDRPTFEQELLSLIRRYAEFVHLLPATPDNYFNAPGGLLRMGLETAFFSLQGTDGHIFSGRATITTRRHLEPRWRHATFIAGLCSEIHRTLCHVIVTNEHGDEWQPYLSPLASWLSAHSVTRFYLKWLPNVHESRTLGVFALPHVVSGEMLQHLATGNTVIVPHMMASISGMPIYRDRNILDDLVRRSVALVVDRYLQASADRYGQPQLGSHLERYLVDALRRIVSSNSAWTPNGEKSRVWYGSDGLFIVWPNAATEMRVLLESDQLPGIPKAPETMLEILIAAGVFEPQHSGQATWHIAPPDLKTVIEAVRLSSPAILFAGLDPEPKPLAVPLIHSAASANAGASAAPNSAAHGGPTLVNTAHKPSPARQLPLPIETEPAPHDRSRATATVGIIGDIAASANPAHAGQARSKHAESTVSKHASVLPTFKLEAPMRLNPAVRDALAQIVDTLNRDGAVAAARTVSAGLFIPLAEFEGRRIEPSLALRALADVGMLVHSHGTNGSSSQTDVLDFGDDKKLGLVLHPRFIAGLDPADFDAGNAGEG